MFYIFGGVAVLAAFLMIISWNPVAAVLNMILVMFCLAGLFVLLNAHFIAVIQILVYAGAIMVLFMFVVMLLNLRGNEPLWKSRDKNIILSFLGALLAVSALMKLSGTLKASGLNKTMQVEESFGTTALVGRILFTDYLLPFEIASILLLVAIVGAVILAKIKIE
ncbi:MAG: NADH-quinone oxidoreductase subunit J [Nitrospinota bacterium]|nr:NADH-quinone oxidoreductase subunit J [Nitrospinota bacterium]